MSWEKTTIGDHCTVTSSKRIHLADRLTNGIPFYCSKEIIEKVSGQRIRDCDYISEDTYEDIERTFGVPRQGDLLMTTRGSFGIPYIYRSTDKFYFADGNLTWLKNFDSELLPHFLYYWILSYEGQKKIEAIAKGTAQKAVPIAAIKNLAICLPPIETQHRIASILSAYDDLIENNRKQIKLLEEAAQRLYKEWFVDLRFPGHENVAVVDGVPEGWRTGTISNIADINRDSISKSYPLGYIDYIDLSAVNKGVVSASTRYTLAEAPGRAKRCVNDGDIIWGMVRPNLRSYALILHPTESTVVSTGFAVLHAKMVPFSFLYCLVTQDSYVGYLINCTNGAAYPAVKPNHFSESMVLIPDCDVLNAFHAQTEPLFRKIEILQKENSRLSEARDRLLPKLMSGEVEV